MSDSLVGSKLEMIALILRPLIPPLALISFTYSLIAFACSVNSKSPENPIWLDSAWWSATGNTTLMVLPEMPLVLVLAWSTGVTPLGVALAVVVVVVVGAVLVRSA